MALDQRLERLERENRWTRRIGAVAVAVLVIGGGYAVYHFATKDPVVFESEETKAARRKAEEAAERAVAEMHQAQEQERRNQAEARAGRHMSRELQLKLRNPINSVYDDETKAPAREAEWQSLADEFEEWSRHELAKQFEEESQYSSRALRRAKNIREQLRNLEASASDKREKIAQMVAKAREINKKLQDRINDLRLNHNYEAAANLCELVATAQPAKEDPFREVVTWEWVSPVDSDLRSSATSIEQIRKVVDESRRDFGKERPRILGLARKVADQVLEKVTNLPETSVDAEYPKLIEELDQLVKSFEADGAERVREIHKHVGAMRKERDRLRRELAKRRTEAPR